MLHPCLQGSSGRWCHLWPCAVWEVTWLGVSLASGGGQKCGEMEFQEVPSSPVGFFLFGCVFFVCFCELTKVWDKFEYRLKTTGWQTNKPWVMNWVSRRDEASVPWDGCSLNCSLQKQHCPHRELLLRGQALQATELLERKHEMSLLGECFVSSSKTVVSWGEVFGGDAGICYCFFPPYPVPNGWFLLHVLSRLALLATSLHSTALLALCHELGEGTDSAVKWHRTNKI